MKSTIEIMTDLVKYMQDATRYVEGEYKSALAKGANTADKDRILDAALAKYNATHQSPESILRAGLDMDDPNSEMGRLSKTIRDLEIFSGIHEERLRKNDPMRGKKGGPMVDVGNATVAHKAYQVDRNGRRKDDQDTLTAFEMPAPTKTKSQADSNFEAAQAFLNRRRD